MRFLKRYAVAVALGLFLIQGIVYYRLGSYEAEAPGLPWSQFPREIAGWRTVEDIPIDAEILANLKPDDYLNRVYQAEGSEQTLSLFIGYFRSQRSGNLPHSPTSCLPGAGWKEILQKPVTLRGADGASFPANIYIIERQERRFAVLFWYQVGETVFTEMWRAQLYSLPNLLLHRNTHQSFVRLVVPVGSAEMSAPTPAASLAGRIPETTRPFL